MKKIITILALVITAMQAGALVRIDIEEGNTDPLPVALTKVVGDSMISDELGENISDFIATNLNDSGLFDVVDEAAYLQSARSLKLNGPDFDQWKTLNITGLFSGNAKIKPYAKGSKVELEFRLFDVDSEKQIIGGKYTADVRYWRRIANRISDDIYTAITGEAGYFTSRIVYIGENVVKGKKGHKRTIKQLCVMNQDTSGQQCLTDGSSIVLTPRFSPVNQELVYLSYANGRPRLYLLDLTTGRQKIVGNFKGLNSSPVFSPNGEKLLMTLTKDEEGNSEIYEMDLDSKRLKKLTFSPGIDTSPSYSPDGKKIVFNSDRGGRPALYIMDKNGNNVKRLTYGRGKYFAPAWSPRGDMVAFVKQLNGKFHIGVIDIDGEEERLLTEGFMDESPTWSPNGRVIAFSRQINYKNKIYAVDLTGYNLREIKTSSDASDPSWSPLLK